MGRRSTTDLCLVVGVDKPAGMTSHDVVNRVRRIFGERRCGHMGTLDPAATGALAVCVGPATRLDPLLTSHDKAYEFTIAFGSATDTDDAEGQLTRTASVPAKVADVRFAEVQVERLVGRFQQMPPVYSAIKVGGRKSYEEARRGKVVELSPREVEIYDARLIAVEGDELEPIWRVQASVSAGTYVRSIARDMGISLGTCAHVGELRRLSAGKLDVRDCCSLELLERDPFGMLLDPVRLLGLRFVFMDPATSRKVAVGSAVSATGLMLCCYDGRLGSCLGIDGCTSGIFASEGPLEPGELVCMVEGNYLRAIYEYDARRDVLKSRCGFAVGVRRG